MKKKQIVRQTKKKWTYICPKCSVIKIESSGFICVSVTPDSQNSGDDSWGSETPHEGGTIDFGASAPAKHSDFWDGDE